MGYYSEIGLCLYKPAYDKMLVELELQSESTKAEVQDLLNSAEKRVANEGTDDESRLYYWNWIKWYSHFEEVKFIEDLLASIGDDDNAEMQYRFVNIGEETEDISVHGSYYENPFVLDVGRGVYMNDRYEVVSKSVSTP